MRPLAGVVLLALSVTACGSDAPSIGEATTCRELAEAVVAVLDEAIETVDGMTAQEVAGAEGSAVLTGLFEPVQQARTQANRLCGGEAAFDVQLDPLLDELDPQSETGRLLVGVLRDS